MHTIENLPTFLSISSKRIKLCSYLCHFRFSKRTNRMQSTEKEEHCEEKKRSMKQKHLQRKERKSDRGEANEENEEEEEKRKITSNLVRVHDSFMPNRFHKHICIERWQQQILLLTKVITVRSVCVCVCGCIFSLARLRRHWNLGIYIQEEIGLIHGVLCSWFVWNVARLIKDFDINY